MTSRAGHYVRLNGKYIRDAEDLLATGDYSQASEKFCGAAAEIVKAAAAQRGTRLVAHKSIEAFVSKLDDENPELNLLSDFASAETLHVNFYEDWSPPEVVRKRAETVKRFIKKMERFL